MNLKSSRKLVTILLLLGICHSVYLIRPSALLKRSFLRRRLLSLPPSAFNGTMRLKRQLFREDIPHHRPLSGNTYYLHAGFPHPSRWHDGPQIIRPNPNPVTHHHHEHHRRPGLHDDLHNNHLNSQHHLHQNELGHPHEPPKVSLVHTQAPHTVTIQSGIVHGELGGLVDNSLGHHHQQHHDHYTPPIHQSVGHVQENIHGRRPKLLKPHSEPESFGEYGEDGDFGLKDHHHHHAHDHGPIGSPSPPPHSIPIDESHHHAPPPRKPKTIIHYHPVTVGNIINFNEDGNKPVSYGPPKHIPGAPLGHPHPDSQKDTLLSIAEPFIKSPFKSVSGPPEFLDFTKDAQYGPPNHAPGHPLGSYDLAPMLPSYGPPIKEDPIPPYSVALPVLAHLHSHPPPPPTAHHHHHHHHHPPHRPGKRHRGGRHHRPPHRRHQIHFHHIHHGPPPPGELGSPFFDIKQPTYVVHGHVPSKLVSLHSPHFKSHAHSVHHQNSFWTL